MIAIIDYGLGNVKAFCNIYNKLNVQYCVANTVGELEKASKIILPGVGAFDHAMSTLNNSGLRDTLDELVLERAVPVLGVCVGMQMMADSSEEGEAAGLKWIPGVVKKFTCANDDLVRKYPLPHMGWNSIYINGDDPITSWLENEPRYYFLHSYYYECENPGHSIATSEYVTKFSCIVKRNNICGVQFHPEKSHHNGISLLKNFAAA